MKAASRVKDKSKKFKLGLDFSDFVDWFTMNQIGNTNGLWLIENENFTKG